MKDYKLDNDGDISWANGDLVVVESTLQHQKDLLFLDKGSLEEFPTSFVGAANYLESEDVSGFLRESRSEFVKDGMTVDVMKLDADGKLITQAKY
jgi:hypothetical protein